MADEVEREEVKEDDVEGQALKQRVGEEAGETAERLPRMSQDENDVEGQSFIKLRNS